MVSIASPRLVLTDLINQIAALHTSEAHPPTKKAHAPHEDGEPPHPNPMKSLPQPAQDLLIALDYLLPDGIGPALDVLDRGLVTRYQLRSDGPVVETPAQGEDADSIALKATAGNLGGGNSENSPPKNRGKYTKKFTPKIYTVRVGSWYCGCEAFTMAAFAGKSTPVTIAGGTGDHRTHKGWRKEEEERVWQHLENSEWVWGGRMLGVENPPICKHLVACALAEHCGGLFMNYVNEVELGFEEMVEKSLGPRV